MLIHVFLLQTHRNLATNIINIRPTAFNNWIIYKIRFVCSENNKSQELVQNLNQTITVSMSWIYDSGTLLSSIYRHRFYKNTLFTTRSKQHRCTIVVIINNWKLIHALVFYNYYAIFIVYINAWRRYSMTSYHKELHSNLQYNFTHSHNPPNQNTIQYNITQSSGIKRSQTIFIMQSNRMQNNQTKAEHSRYKRKIKRLWQYSI